MNAVTRYLASRDNRFFQVALGLATVLGLWGLRLPGFDLVFILAALVILLIAALLILSRLIIRLILARKYRGEIPRPFEGGLVWLEPLYVFSLLLILGFYRLPFKAAFALSRPSLDRFAQKAAAGQEPKGPFWLGLFPFKYAAREEGVIQINFNKEEFPWGQRGLYYSLSGDHVGDSYYRSQKSLGGGWYEWHYSGW